MEDFVNRLLIEPAAQLTVLQLLESALGQFYAFTLVVVRMSGLMVVGPVFGQSLVPANVRVFIVLAVSMIITPTLSDQPKLAFQRLDTDKNERLARDEVPEHLLVRYDALVAQSTLPAHDGLSLAQFRYNLAPPATVLDYTWVAAGEFGLGLMLGLGVLTILSGLQLAGETIDQQTGTAIGEIANPALDINGSVTGQFLFMFAVTVLLLMEPTGYHLVLMSALVQTFQTIPVGDAFVSTSAIELLRDLVHESLILGVQVAAPILATMSLVGLTMGFLGHTVPQVNVLVVGFPVRAVINLLVLAVTLSGAAQLVIDIVPGVIDRMFHALALV